MRCLTNSLACYFPDWSGGARRLGRHCLLAVALIVFFGCKPRFEQVDPERVFLAVDVETVTGISGVRTFSRFERQDAYGDVNAYGPAGKPLVFLMWGGSRQFYRWRVIHSAGSLPAPSSDLGEERFFGGTEEGIQALFVRQGDHAFALALPSEGSSAVHPLNPAVLENLARRVLERLEAVSDASH